MNSGSKSNGSKSRKVSGNRYQGSADLGMSRTQKIEGGATGAFVSYLNLKPSTKEKGNLNVSCEEDEGTEQEKAEARGNKRDYVLVIVMDVLLVSFVFNARSGLP
ncbi:hypothetical protein U1Q18_007544 [Sarracenia purpurea var. burkii]